MEHSSQDGVSNPTPSLRDPTTPLPAYDRRDNHLKTLKCLTIRLKEQLKLGEKPEPEIVKIPSYIDFLRQKCEQTDDKHSLTQIPPLSYEVKTPRCKIEGSVDCYTTGYICFFLQASRQQDESSPKPIMFDVRVFLGHPDQGEPLMFGEKKLILKHNKKVKSPVIITTCKDIQRSKYVKEDMIHFWWQVWVRESPTEIDLERTKEISNAMSVEGKNLRELCKDSNINKIADVADGICTCLEPTIFPEPVSFRYRIDKIDQVLLENKEMYTPLQESSSHGYLLQGFLLCGACNILAAYLYLGPVTGNEELIWPVKIHWKVSLVNQALKKRKCLGEKISVYDKATQADNSLLDDDSRIEFTKDDIELSGMITNQSLTVEWTVWLDSPIYAVKAAHPSHQCDELLSSIEDVLLPYHSEPGQPGNQDKECHIRYQDMVHLGEQFTRVSGNFDLMVIGKSGEAKRMAGNSILQQHDFTKEEAEDKVKEAWRQFDDHIVTVVDCPLICNFKSEESDKPGTAGHRLTNALVKFGDGFHAILFVSNIDTTFNDEELESIEFLKTHLADNIVRDFFIFVMIHNNDSNSESENEFIHWCKMQTDAFGALLKECKNRYVLFHNANNDLSRNAVQRQKLLSTVSEMKSREFRMKKRCLDWNRIPSGTSHSKMEMILKRTQVLVQAFKEAKQLYSDPEAAKCQIDELEKKACLLEKEISTCDDNSCMMMMKSTIIQLKATIASDRDIIEESKTLKDRIKQATIKCEELEQELEKKKMEFEKQLTNVHSEEVEALKKKIAELESQLDYERKTLTMYEKLYKESLKKPHEDYQILKETLIKEYEEMTSRRKKMHEEEMTHFVEREKKFKEESEKRWHYENQNLKTQLETMTKRNEEEQAKHTEDIQILMKENEQHKKEKDDMRVEIEAMSKHNEEEQAKHTEDIQILMKENEQHKKEKDDMRVEIEAMSKHNEEEQAKHNEDIQILMRENEKHEKEKDDMSDELEQEKKSKEENEKRWQKEKQNLQTELEKMRKQSETEQEEHDKEIQKLRSENEVFKKKEDVKRVAEEKMLQTLTKRSRAPTYNIVNGPTDLMEAAREGFTKCVMFLVEKNILLDEFGRQGKTALMLTAENGSDECLKLLIQAKSEIDKGDKAGMTALMFVATNQSDECVKLLIQANSEIDKCDNLGRTALMFAAIYRSDECVKLLIQAKSDLDKSDKDGRTALMLAVMNGSDECVKLLIQAKSETDKCDILGSTALMFAAANRSDECLKLLIQAKSEIDKGDRAGMTALMFAATNQSDECVKLLIQAESEIDKCDNLGRTALMLAAMCRSDECVKLLIQAKSDLDKSDKDGRTALMLAVMNGFDECVKLLIQAKSEIDKGDKDGRTALMLAVMNGSDECVKLLIQAKSEIDKGDNLGSTALILGAMYGSDECMKLLIQAKSEIDKSDKAGMTALMSAAMYGCDECVKLLIQANSEIDKCDNLGSTALILAVRYGCDKSVKVLIEANSQIDKTDKHGKTAKDYAKKMKIPEYLKLFKEAKLRLKKK